MPKLGEVNGVTPKPIFRWRPNVARLCLATRGNFPLLEKFEKLQNHLVLSQKPFFQRKIPKINIWSKPACMSFYHTWWSKSGRSRTHFWHIFDLFEYQSTPIITKMWNTMYVWFLFHSQRSDMLIMSKISFWIPTLVGPWFDLFSYIYTKNI